MSEICLTILCPPSLDESLLDLLLLSPHVTVFTSAAIAVHGMAFGQLDQSEQVLGRASAIQVQAFLADVDRQLVLDSLNAQFPGTGMRYWISPVLETGAFA